MKRLILIILAVMACMHLSAQGYEEYAKAYKERLSSYKKQKEQALYESMEAYLAYEKAEKEKYEAYKKKVMGKWGDKDMVESTKTTWVDYSEDLTSRTNVDFENGEVKIDILVDIDEEQKVIQEKLEEVVIDLTTVKDTLTGKTIMENQLEVKKEDLKKTVPVVTTVKTDEGQKKVVSIKMELNEDHLSTRAAQYKDIVKRFSDKFGLEQPLVYAMIETESAFNPKAKSHVPAYGLMQLVPKSGGRDAYRHVHKKDIIPAPVYLYVPENNVELGAGYLNMLMTRTFAEVKDARSRMLCAIAAYNTGAGNVSRALTGGTSVSKAVVKINTMSYDQLFSYLKRNLPYEETRNYIQKVTERMEKYKK